MDSTAHLFNVTAHIAFGILGLAAGLVPLLSRKGGHWHRRMGRVFTGFAIIVLSTAILAELLLPQPFALVAATVAAAYNLASGLRALQVKATGPGWPDVLLALAALALCAALFGHMGRQGTVAFNPVVGYATLGYVALLCLYDISRLFWRRIWLARVRPIDHGVKMIAVFFGMMSAGLGNLFPQLQPWSAVGPIMFGNLVTIGFVIAYFTRRA